MSDSIDNPGSRPPTNPSGPSPGSKPSRSPGIPSQAKPTVYTTASGTDTLDKLTARSERDRITLETLTEFRKKHYGTAGIE